MVVMVMVVMVMVLMVMVVMVMVVMVLARRSDKPVGMWGSSRSASCRWTEASASKIASELVASSTEHTAVLDRNTIADSSIHFDLPGIDVESS